MPRPIRTMRSVEGEANLAERIRIERERAGLSYEALAKLMTDAGCRMQGSAIFKIEKGDPPRRIAVDELIAFAAVFGVPVENLLTPVAVLRTERGKKLLKEIEEADDALIEAIGRQTDAWAEFFELIAYEPDLAEYVENHKFHRPTDGEASAPLLAGVMSIPGQEDVVLDVDDEAVRKAIVGLVTAIYEVAGNVAEKAIEENKKRGIFPSSGLADRED